MKKYLYFFIAGLLSLNLLACNPVNGSTENSEDTGKTGEITDTEESKKEGYEILVGTKWNLDTNEEYNEETLETAPKTITFKKDEIIIDDKPYRLVDITTTYSDSYIDFAFDDATGFLFTYNYYGPDVSWACFYTKGVHYTDELIYNLDTSYTGDNGGSSTGEGENFELSGEYVISETHKFGNLVFSNGSWSVTQNTSSGTYSLNNNVLTVRYDAYGTSVSADFKVSVFGSEITFEVLDSNSNFAAILGGFGVQDREALETGKITLTKN